MIAKIHKIIIIMLIIMSVLINYIAWIKCSSSVSIPLTQFTIKSNFGDDATPVIFQKGIMDSNHSIYYGAISSGDSIFMKENSIHDILWTKKYSPFTFYQDAMVMRNDETAIYVMKEGSSTINILKINTSDGTLMGSVLE